MKKYDEYKDSGVAWIGDVPKHWEILRGKYVLKILSGFPFDSQKFEFEDNGVYMPLIRIRDINGSSTEVYYSGSYPIESVVKTGEVLIGMDGDFNISKWKGTNALLNQRVCKLREDSSMNTHYAFYMLSSPLKAINSVTYATTVKHLSVYDIYNAFIPVPPMSEQAAISTYLDTHCAKIDNLISIQQKRIALLQELKQSVITHAVTKGLNPNVKMKQSGVEWIGAVPKHWELVRTRYLCNLCTGSKDTINRVDDGKYPFYVRSPKVERIDTYSFDGEAILMAGDGVGAGKVFHYAVGKFDYHQRVYNFHNFKHVLGKFFYNYISNNFKYIIEEGGAKNTVDSVRLYMIQNFMTTVPPLEEQMEICNYIEQKEKVFDTSISNAQHQIELLQEYKQSLITEVVTGKRKVTDN